MTDAKNEGAGGASRSDAGLGADGLLHDRCHNELRGARPAKTAVVHVTPAINEECAHDWEGADGNPERCSKCGLSFMRYVHSCCP